MKESVGDEKLIIISVAVRGINDHIRFYSQMLCTAAINTSNTTRTQTGARRQTDGWRLTDWLTVFIRLRNTHNTAQVFKNNSDRLPER